MEFFFALLGDALLFAALSWFAGYGAMGPITGVRLTVPTRLRLLGEVFVLTLVLLYLIISADQLVGWVEQPPWPGSPPPHRLVAIGVLLTVGFLYTRRRASAFHRRDGAAEDLPS